MKCLALSRSDAQELPGRDAADPARPPPATAPEAGQAPSRPPCLRRRRPRQSRCLAWTTAACTFIANSRSCSSIFVCGAGAGRSYPLLERLKFLLIFSSNLDEFLKSGWPASRSRSFARELAGADGLQPHRHWRASASWCTWKSTGSTPLNDVLLPELKTPDPLHSPPLLDTQAQDRVRRYFRDEIAPIITPIGLDPTHPFPLLVNKSLNFIVELEGVDAFGRDSPGDHPCTTPAAAGDCVPEEVGGPGANYVFLSSMIHAHADDLFQA